MDEMDNFITFSINNRSYKVAADIPADTSLNTFIRDYANLKGTKVMCKEGGCGACIVTVRTTDPVDHMEKEFAVNSCLVPVWSCSGTKVTTVEGLGDRKKGYHKIQKYLAHFNGTQCGYCSPGMIMNMYGLLISKPNITMTEIENSFGGNICRCTGYRPILDAFKALASDATDDLRKYAVDIEDVAEQIGCTNGINGVCYENCNNCPKKLIIQKVDTEGNIWYTLNRVQELFNLLNKIGNTKYMLLAGNTAQGVYRIIEKPKIYIDITKIQELKEHAFMKDKLELGANITLSECMQLFAQVAQLKPKKFSYLKQLVEHIDLVANVPVRNIGTLAGNLMIKHEHKIFPSDIFLIFETVGAKLVLETMDGTVGPISLLQFLKYDMKKALIRKIILPPLAQEEIKLKTFKIMPRKQNVHAYVNAGFLFSVGSGNIVLGKPTIVYGGISENFIHAERTESYFTGKCILDEKVFKEGMRILSLEVNPTTELLKSSPQYRKQLSLSLFYRFVLGINPLKMNEHNRSGMENLIRPLSKGKQSFAVSHENPPVGKPVSKVEANIQCSGEAEYTGDIKSYPEQVFAALVLARKAKATIHSVDAEIALKMPGVLAFYTAKDIPGKNSFIKKFAYSPSEEELFCSRDIMYAGQAIGVIIAESQELANRAAIKVNITYKNKQKPLLTVRDVLQANDVSRITLDRTIQPTVQLKNENIKYTIKGEYEMGPQYHFTMETQCCLCVPTDEGLNIYSATQWMDNIQSSVGALLNIPESSINMQVKRLGGGFGCKITRSSIVAGACALAAYKLNRPVKIVLDLETNMECIGKRSPALSFYEAAFDENGKIQELKVSVYDDVGCSYNDPSSLLIPPGLYNAYDFSTWKIDIYTVLTDNASAAWMRAPGTIEGIATIETIMEHIATRVAKDPLDIRMVNLDKKYTLLNTLIQNVLVDSDYEASKLAIKQFNKANRWKKKGISVMPVVFPVDFFFSHHAMVSIYSGDGTVTVTHGGVEMGQGVNTKVAQAVSYALGVDMKMVKIKANSNITAPNDGMSGASVTSESCVLAALKCCEILNNRLAPLKSKMNNPTWPELIYEAFVEEIDLNASSMTSYRSKHFHEYIVYAVAVTQVEVDLLTGNYQILRTDIIEDAGDSLSPLIDVGQIEGAFVMGLGYFLTESIKHDPDSGMVITNRTWNYWPPGVKDIPVDFRVTLAKNAPNITGVMRSKSTGEPPICLALSAVTAIRDALKSARLDTGLKNHWFNLDQPCSVERTFLAANTSYEQFSLYC
ncbi:uncharacterized protein isoform X1 [Rhodnius prolixus]|uniref:uncharacterized protein isoform X1 n=2 Tax=Rhodnius prolixus TaxID=13249 RepID=UPI003D18CF1A